MLASAPTTGAPSAMSSALPCGRPSTTSKIVTSPSSRYAASCARTPPMLPPPISEILLRAMCGGIPLFLLSALALGGARLRRLARLLARRALRPRRRLRLGRLAAAALGAAARRRRPAGHVRDDGVAELRALEQLRAGHQPVEVVGDPFGRDRARD